MKLFKRIIYYKDLRLFSLTFLKLSQIYTFRFLKKDHLFFSLVPDAENKYRRSRDAQKIIRYADICILLFRKVGIKDTCLTRALLYCCALRQAGFDVKINFGVKKTKGILAGHCWLKQDIEKNSDFKVIFSYP